MRIYLTITRDNDGGYRSSLRSGLHETRARMQSAKAATESAAKHDAERLFGKVRWQAPVAVGCELGFVTLIAELEVGT